jgi:hypothetical protein
MSEDIAHMVDARREQLRELASRVRPFPTFLGRNWLEAVEVEPVGGLADVDRGCVVVCPDGELYELVLRLLPGAEVVSDPNPAEELTPLAVSDGEHVVWAKAALKALGQYVE